MNLYEYQAKDLFKKYGIPVPEGKITRTYQRLTGISFQQ